jgi:hypothetical protein
MYAAAQQSLSIFCWLDGWLANPTNFLGGAAARR